uniref:Chitin-binding type-2 domain-containing protein n=1 Tax=Panagrellus redivivus TaxID=6233 RepID=A0A7E4UQ98_PANRE
MSVSATMILQKLFVLAVCVGLANSEFLRPCYFTDWAHYRQGNAKYEPEAYVPGLCTHIFFAFAKVNWDNTAAAFDEEDTPQGPNGGYYARVNALKKKQPGLKTVLSFGGYSAGTGQFTTMASSAANRATFIKSALMFVQKYGFDGIDIDWEYPDANTKANYATFIKELKNAFGKLLVTAAVTANPATAAAGYDIPTLGKYLDFLNVMTYDFHGSWDHVTGMNSPLFAAPGDTSNWNSAYAVNYWADNGFPKNKILMGIASYGRGWTLTDPSNHGVGAPGQTAPNFPVTQTGGFGAYWELCPLIASGKRYFDNDEKVPYFVNGNLWFSYDDVESVGIKMKYIKDNNFGGAFVWTLDFDDFNTICAGGSAYPIINAMKVGLEGGSPLTVPTPKPGNPTQAPVTQPAGPTQKPVTQKPGGPFTCPSDNGFFSDPADCKSYYECVNGTPYHFTCGDGLEWNESIKSCDWPTDTTCFQKKK